MLILVNVDIFIIGRGIDTRWLPAVGFGLGLGLTCFGFWTYREFKSYTGLNVAQREIVAVISGLLLCNLGFVFLVASNSLALVLNIDWLHGLRFISAFLLFWFGFWIITLFSEVFNDFRLWKYIGLGVNGLLLVFVVVKLFFGFG